MTEDEWIEKILKDDSPFMSGVDLDGLVRGRAVRLNISPNPYAIGFNTPSGRVEFFSKDMEARGLDPLPSGDVIRDPEGGEDYPLEFITPPHPMLLNSAFNEVKAIRDTLGTPRVLIHPRTAGARHIGDGDPVRVFNGRGSAALPQN